MKLLNGLKEIETLKMPSHISEMALSFFPSNWEDEGWE
jgi:hypothetical protein